MDEGQDVEIKGGIILHPDRGHTAEPGPQEVHTGRRVLLPGPDHGRLGTEHGHGSGPVRFAEVVEQASRPVLVQVHDELLTGQLQPGEHGLAPGTALPDPGGQDLPHAACQGGHQGGQQPRRGKAGCRRTGSRQSPRARSASGSRIRRSQRRTSSPATSFRGTHQSCKPGDGTFSATPRSLSPDPLVRLRKQPVIGDVRIDPVRKGKSGVLHDAHRRSPDRLLPVTAIS